jgi:hypothetical protein
MQEIPLHEEFSVTDLKTITRHPDTGSSKKESENKLPGSKPKRQII